MGDKVGWRAKTLEDLRGPAFKDLSDSVMGRAISIYGE